MTYVSVQSTGASQSQFLVTFYHQVSPRRIRSPGLNGFLVGGPCLLVLTVGRQGGEEARGGGGDPNGGVTYGAGTGRTAN
jgi:hypothetical protein